MEEAVDGKTFFRTRTRFGGAAVLQVGMGLGLDDLEGEKGVAVDEPAYTLTKNATGLSPLHRIVNSEHLYRRDPKD